MRPRAAAAAGEATIEDVKTLRLTVDPEPTWRRAEADEALERAAEILRAGGLVALPTETVYGLGANALDRGRGGTDFRGEAAAGVGSGHRACRDRRRCLRDWLTEVPERARRLMEAFWPGPLTLLLPRTPRCPMR